MTGLVQRAQQRVKRFVRKWDADIASARRSHGVLPPKVAVGPVVKFDSVILMSYWPHKISLCCVNAHTVNYLARRTGSGIETYAIFGGREHSGCDAFTNRVWRPLGIGCKLGRSGLTGTGKAGRWDIPFLEIEVGLARTGGSMV